MKGACTSDAKDTKRCSSGAAVHQQDADQIAFEQFLEQDPPHLSFVDAYPSIHRNVGKNGTCK